MMNVSPRFGSIFVVDARHLGTQQAKALKEDIAQSYPSPGFINAATPKSLAYPVMDAETRGLKDNAERLFFATVEDANDEHFQAITKRHEARIENLGSYNPDAPQSRYSYLLFEVLGKYCNGAANFSMMTSLGEALAKMGGFLAKESE